MSGLYALHSGDKYLSSMTIGGALTLFEGSANVHNMTENQVLQKNHGLRARGGSTS